MNSDYSHDAWAKKYHSSHRNIEDRAATSAEAHQVQGSLKSKRIWQGRRRCCGISMLHLWDQNRTKHKEDTGAALSSAFGSVLEVEPKCKVYLSATSMAMGEKESRLSLEEKGSKDDKLRQKPPCQEALRFGMRCQLPHQPRHWYPHGETVESSTQLWVCWYSYLGGDCFCVLNEEPDLPNVSNLFPKSSCYWT